MRGLLIVLLLAFGAQACGSKGPLYLPEQAPQAKRDNNKPKPQ